MGLNYYLIAIPLDIFGLWIGIKGIKVLIHAMRTGHLTKKEKESETFEEFFNDFVNGCLIFFGACFYFPISIYLTIGIVYSLVIDLFK